MARSTKTCPICTLKALCDRGWAFDSATTAALAANSDHGSWPSSTASAAGLNAWNTVIITALPQGGTMDAHGGRT